MEANDNMEAGFIADWEEELDTEEECVLTGQQIANLEKTTNECELKLKEVKDLIQKALWSNFGDAELSIALKAADVEWDRISAIKPSGNQEGYVFMLNLLQGLVKTAKEVHSQWK